MSRFHYQLYECSNLQLLYTHIPYSTTTKTKNQIHIAIHQIKQEIIIIDRTQSYLPSSTPKNPLNLRLPAQVSSLNSSLRQPVHNTFEFTTKRQRLYGSILPVVKAPGTAASFYSDNYEDLDKQSRTLGNYELQHIIKLNRHKTSPYFSKHWPPP